MAEPAFFPVEFTTIPCVAHHLDNAMTGSLTIADLLTILEDSTFSAAS